MFNNDSTQADASLTELYAEVLGPNEIDDVLVEIDAGEFTFSVEFCDFERGRLFNVASMPVGTNYPEKLANALDLPVVDKGDIFVVFETDAATAEQAVSELEGIATTMGASAEDVTTKKRRQIETGAVNQAAMWMMDKLGIGPNTE